MSLRGGYQQQDGCLLFSFTGQLDAYSEKQFLAFISEHLTSTPQPLVIDLDRKSTRLNSSHCALSRMPSSA